MAPVCRVYCGVWHQPVLPRPLAPPTEAVLEFECKSQERSALSTELRNSRQASRVYVVKGRPEEHACLVCAVKQVLLIRALPACVNYCEAIFITKRPSLAL